MSKFFILVASLMCISTLAACSGRASTESDPTSICAVGLRPFDAACTEARFDVNKLQHCNSQGLSTRNFQTGAPHADLAQCTALMAENTCLENPFQEVCETTAIFEDDIDGFRFGRFSLCGFGGGSGAPCAFINSCTDNGNPFDAECLKHDIFDSNRATRVTLCTPEDVTAPSVIAGCAGANLVGTRTITECIATNPFHADCTHDAFDAARVARVAACSEASPNAALNCNSVIGVDIGTDDGTQNDGRQTIANCITEPFHIDCQNLAFNTSRVNRLIACSGANVPSEGMCTEAHMRATSANWLRSFDGSNNNPRLGTEPDTSTNAGNQFLQGTQVVPVMLDEDDPDAEPEGHEGGLDVGEVRTITGDQPVVFSLNLASAFYGEGEDRDFLITDEEGDSAGDVSDGVAFFLGSAARDANAYAGILAGTDLGAPPTETTGTAEWNGQFRVIGTYFVNKDFTLNITFSNRNVRAFVQVNEEEDPLHFSLNGTFDDTTGVINGTVELGDYTDNVNAPANLLTNENRGSGRLTGLIGIEGAVGVFLKNNDDPGKSFNFAGGFVAAPAN